MTETESPRLAADAPPTCSTPGCGQPATFAFTWDWGQSGHACSPHAALLNQTAQNLSRTVQVAPLAAAGPPPLLRDERIALTAKAMVVEAELTEAKGRGLDLYRENVALTQQVQSHVVRNRELDAQLKDAKKSIELLEQEREGREAELGELVDEVGRLRVLAKFVDPPFAASKTTAPTAPPTPKA